MNELEPEYHREKGQNSGSNTLYTVEARYDHAKPVEICGQLFDTRWSQVHFETHEGTGVPELRSWNSLAEAPGMLRYVSAQAMRWWFHAEAEKCGGGFLLVTRLVKHEIKWSKTVVAVSQHCIISKDLGSNFIPDWNEK